MLDPQMKVRGLETTLAWRAELRRTGQFLVMTNGCFDLLHPGHVDYLNRARGEGDALLVATNSDLSLRGLKGPDRPFIPQAGRTLMLASLAAVDSVLVFEENNCVRLLQDLQPDVYVKGGDYTLDTINQDERQVLDTIDCRVAFLPFLDGFSSSILIKALTCRSGMQGANH